MPTKILHLEDSPLDAELVRARLEKEGLDAEVTLATGRQEFAQAIERTEFDLIFADHSLPDFDGFLALEMARAKRPQTPFIFVSATLGEEHAIRSLQQGATDYVFKQRLDRLAPAVRRAILEREERARLAHLEGEQAALLQRERIRSVQLVRLAAAFCQLNAAHDIASVLGIITAEARTIIGAHEAAAVLSGDGDAGTRAISTSTNDSRARIADLPFHPKLVAGLGQGGVPRRFTPGQLKDFCVANGIDADCPLDVLNIRGAIAVPLALSSGQKIGLLWLANKIDDDFDADDESMLVQVAQIASVAIENARLYQMLRDRDRKKDEFLAMLAHELRNPLAGLGNSLELLRMEARPERRGWAMEAAGRQHKNLARLVDDLLDVSRITTGKITLKQKTLNLALILDSAIAAVRGEINAREHRLEATYDRDSLFVDGDPTRLEQIFANLLHNSAKYTEPGGSITLTAERDGASVWIRVRDTGVGISAQKLREVFDLFVQGERTPARAEGGLGVGLTIVQRLTELHGGAVAASSAGPGRGSVFTVRLPFSLSRPESRGEFELAAPSIALKVLVVDDNIDTATSMAFLLELLGHTITTAHDGEAAVEAVSRFAPDVILLDIGLPKLDGYQVAAKVRDNPTIAQPAIIAVSGYGQQEDRRRSHEARFDHHLVKPVELDTLTALIARLKPAEAAR